MPPRYKALNALPVLFAHRGGTIAGRKNTEFASSEKLADNSLQAFQRTLGLLDNAEKSIKAWGVESDAWLTEDHKVVLSHKHKIPRRHFLGKLFKLNIKKTDSSQLPPDILSLDEFYRVLGADFEFSLDVKDSKAIQNIISAAKKTDGAFERLWICSPNFKDLCSWRKQWPDAQLIHSTKLSRLGKSIESHLRELSEAKINGINLHYSEYSAGLVSLVHRFQILAFGWDTQKIREIIKVLDMGLDAIYGDNPELLLAGRNEVYASKNL